VSAGALAGRKDLVEVVRKFHHIMGGVVDPHAGYVYMSMLCVVCMSMQVPPHHGRRRGPVRRVRLCTTCRLFCSVLHACSGVPLSIQGVARGACARSMHLLLPLCLHPECMRSPPLELNFDRITHHASCTHSRMITFDHYPQVPAAARHEDAGPARGAAQRERA
jgi:hypothetical protein